MVGKSKTTNTETISDLVDSAILTLHSIRDMLDDKSSEDEEMYDKIRSETLKMITGET